MLRILFFPFFFLSTSSIGYDGLYPHYASYPPFDMGRTRDYHTASTAPLSPPLIPDDLLRSTMQMQSTQLAEITLNSHKDKGCFMRTVCAVATLDPAETHEYSMAQGVLEFRRLLEEMVAHMEDEEEKRQKFFPNIHRTLGSFEVGSSTKDLSLCEKLFPCKSLTAEELVEDSLASPGTSIRQGRTTCVAAGNLCPGVSIGCALCGIFLQSTCAIQCTISGLYCGVSGYACQAEAESAVEKAMEKLANDEDKQKEFMRFMFGDLAEHIGGPKAF